MKRKIAHIISICLAMTLIFGTIISASARASSLINTYDASIAKNSNKTVSVNYTIKGTGTMDKIGASSIKIQKYNSSTGGWSDAETMTTSNTSGLQKSSAASYTNTVTSGTLDAGTYRAYIVFYASSGSDSDSKNYTTTSVTIS